MDYDNNNRKIYHNDEKIHRFYFENVNTQDDDGATPLHIVLSKKQKEDDDDDIKFLIEVGANVNAQDNYGETPLFYSIYYKSGVELLIKAGADVNRKNNNGKTPLQCVLENRYDDFDDDIAVALIKADADVNFIIWADVQDHYHGDTPFHYAVREKNIKMVRALLEAGADVNIKNYARNTPIQCLYHGYLPINFNDAHFLKAKSQSTINYNEVLQLLLDNGADEIEYLKNRRMIIPQIFPDFETIHNNILNKKKALLGIIHGTYIHKKPIKKHYLFDQNVFLKIFQFFDNKKINKKNKKNKKRKF
jgi:ankyrin repeat protein